jgi:hypothetical protein
MAQNREILRKRERTTTCIGLFIYQEEFFMNKKIIFLVILVCLLSFDFAFAQNDYLDNMRRLGNELYRLGRDRYEYNQRYQGGGYSGGSGSVPFSITNEQLEILLNDQEALLKLTNDPKLLEVLKGILSSEQKQMVERKLAAMNAPSTNVPLIRDGTTRIEDEAFHGRGLTSVTIPNSVTSIGNWAFSNNQLTSITIPNSVTSIGNYAFSNNQFTSVTIPNSVTNIGRGAFASCTNLTTINTDIGNTAYISIDGILYTKDKKILVAYPAGKKGTVTIPDSVISIGDGAFFDNKLTSVIIPDSVTSIGDYAFNKNQLTSVTIPDSVTSIGDSAFFDNKLTSVTIPDSVTSIGKNAFLSNQITRVTIPDSVTFIGDSAFLITELINITIGSNVSFGNNHSFPYEFSEYYNRNGKKAGTYVYNKGWRSR